VLLLLRAACPAQSISKDAAGQVTGVTAELHLAGDFKKTKLKLTWLVDVPDLVPLTCTEFDYLITKKKVRRNFCMIWTAACPAHGRPLLLRWHATRLVLLPARISFCLPLPRDS
jgi:hypothetical protein